MNEPAKHRCPHLYAHNQTGDTYFVYPSRGNCCRRMRTSTKGILWWRREVPPHIEIDHQERYCLTEDSTGCSLLGTSESDAEPT